MSEEDFKSATFEEKMQMIYGKLNEKQKRESREQVIYMCKEYCGKCPTYQGTGETALAFCMEGKSSIIAEKKACLCRECPISKTMSLRWSHYCIRGSALECSESEK
ncbi:MAG TPA: DUF2769 domain-containing protein [Candidatus Deferrimicrobium sp.]|nr:DUF2769 domain-containing protein [Candidatus Deferrimicrobium sp.]